MEVDHAKARAQSASVPGDDASFDWPMVRSAVGGRWWIVALGIGIGLVTAVTLGRAVDPFFDAHATIWMDAGGGWEPESGATRQARLFDDRGWRDVLRSHAVLLPVVEALRLYLRPSRAADRALLLTLPVDGDLRSGRYELRASEDGTQWILDRDGTELERVAAGGAFVAALRARWSPPSGLLHRNGTIRFRIERPHEAAERLSRELDVRVEGPLLHLGLRGRDPDLVAETVNRIANSFVGVAAELHRARMESMVANLSEQVRFAQSNLLEAELDLEEFRVRTVSRAPEEGEIAVSGVEQTRGPVFERFHRLRMEAEELRQEEAALRRALTRSAERGLVPVETLEAVPSVRTSSELSAALELATSRRMLLRALRLEFTDESLAVREVVEDLAVLEESTIPSLVADLLAELGQRREALEASADRLGADLQEIPAEAIEEARLERRFRSAEAFFAHLQDRFESARLASVITAPEIRVLDAARVPEVPTSDPRGRVRVLATVLGLGLGLWGAVLRERLDPRFRRPDQVQRDLGLPILAAVPRARAWHGRPRDVDLERAREAFRALRLALLHTAPDEQRGLVCTVTSPGSGDGKSFTTGNAALAFAELGRRTLVIDGDVRRGTMHRHFDVERRPGLTDHLAGDLPAERIIRATGHPLIDVVPSGSRLREAPELLGGPRMRSLLGEARSRYDVVLIDTPPLAASADAHLLGILSGAVLLVVRRGATDRAQTGPRVQELERLPVRLLGVVLNDVPVAPRAYGYDAYRRYLPGYGAGGEAPVGSARPLTPSATGREEGP